MSDIICLGEALIDFMPLESGKKLTEVSGFRKVAGGAPANVAVGVARLNRSAAFLGRVGDDEFGYFLKQTIENNGVDVSQMQYDRQARTGLAFVSLPTPNTRKFLFYRNPSADMMLDWELFDINFLNAARVLHFGSITLISEPSRSSTLKAAEIARANGSLVSYDPNLRPALWPDMKLAAERIEQPLSMADMVKVNDDELAFITSEEDYRKGMDSILARGPRLVILTLGQKGSYYRTATLYGKIEAFKVDTVDSTGCGDSFVAGLLCGILDNELDKVISEEQLLKSILRFSSAAAAITSTGKGVIGSLPSRQRVNNFLKKLQT